MTWLALFIVPAFVAYFVSVIRRTGLLTADSIFVYLQLIMALGTLPLLMPDQVPADRMHGYFLVSTLFIYMAVSALIQWSWPRDEFADARRPEVHQLKWAGWFWLLFSVVLVVAYYRVIGYSAFATGLTGLISGQAADVASLRLESYSGGTYLAPGYVNQFKNALLPALVIVVIASRWRSEPRRPRPVSSLALTLFTAFALLGTGQRGAFVLAAVLVAVFVYLNAGRHLSGKAVVGLGVAFVPILTLATAVLGRTAGDTGLVAQLATLAYRVTGSNQESSVAGWRFIYNRSQSGDVGAGTPGAEWLKALEGILPGSTGSSLDNQIYATLFGTDRGTAPPSLWGSVYHNFGTPGLIIAPILLAIVMTTVTRLGVRSVERNTLEVVGIAGVFVVLGFWVAGSPVSMLNNGVVIYGLLWYGGIKARRREEQIVEEPPTSLSTGRQPLRVGAVTPTQPQRWRSGSRVRRNSVRVRADGF